MNGADVPTEIAFTAASTMKVPIMLSVLKRTAEPTPDWILELMEGMIVRSENPPADSLMEQVIDPVSGPLDVTADMQALGLQNTFIAGYFYLGAPLLQLYDTPANTRTDINLQPDVYNQTTPGEIGRVLEDIYQCAESGSGELISTFSGQISSDECKLVISYLLRNKTALLLEAGVPEGTPIAHKHGWIEEADGLLHTMSDVAIIYTPGGNYVLNVFLYHPVQLVFDPANIMIAQISQAVYNFFNYN
jgi:beta-lactamase class A